MELIKFRVFAISWLSVVVPNQPMAFGEPAPRPGFKPRAGLYAEGRRGYCHRRGPGGACRTGAHAVPIPSAQELSLEAGWADLVASLWPGRARPRHSGPCAGGRAHLVSTSGWWSSRFRRSWGRCSVRSRGYFGGAIDDAISRLIDMLLAFPGLLLAPLRSWRSLGPSLVNVLSR